MLLSLLVFSSLSNSLAVAERIAAERGQNIGTDVGYKVQS